MYYLLDENKKPIPYVGDIRRFYELFAKQIRVKQENLKDCRVSTVFLGFDHSGEIKPEKPILWETMIFGGEYD